MDPASRSSFDVLAADVRAQRRSALRALHVLEYALEAPAPRRHRTWLHRVTLAVDALHAALHEQLPVDATSESIGLLDEIALSHPGYIPRIRHLQEERRDLDIAVASLREHLELDSTIEIDPDNIRDRLATLTRRFREHRARETDLVYETIGRDVDEE